MGSVVVRVVTLWGIIYPLVMVSSIYACPASICDCSHYNDDKSLWCENRTLTSPPADLPVDSRVLRLQFNNIQELDAGVFSGLPELTALLLFNNRITEIQDGAFAGLDSLKYLNLRSNGITHVTRHTFEGMPNLQVLLLGWNNLSSLPSGIFGPVPCLVDLDLASNGLGQLEPIVSKDLANLVKIDLSHNLESVVQLSLFAENFGSLEILYLNCLRKRNATPLSVDLPDTVFAELDNLTELMLNGNGFNRIPLAIWTLRNLTSLSLSSNKIHTVNADDLPSSLRYLELDNNTLSEIPTSVLTRLPHLRGLYLHDNPISKIPPRAFWNNQQLQSLSIGLTNLSSIDKEAFVGLDQLSRLWLDNNNLTTISDGTMDNVNPSVDLWLFGNRFDCDCRIRGFVKWLQTNHTGKLEGCLPRCLTPEHMKDTVITSIQAQQLACKPRPTGITPIPTTPQNTPTTPQNTPTTPQNTPTTPQNTPKTPQNTPKTPQDTPKHPQDTPKHPQDIS